MLRTSCFVQYSQRGLSTWLFFRALPARGVRAGPAYGAATPARDNRSGPGQGHRLERRHGQQGTRAVARFRHGGRVDAAAARPGVRLPGIRRLDQRGTGRCAGVHADVNMACNTCRVAACVGARTAPRRLTRRRVQRANLVQHDQAHPRRVRVHATAPASTAPASPSPLSAPARHRNSRSSS